MPKHVKKKVNLLKLDKQILNHIHHKSERFKRKPRDLIDFVAVQVDLAFKLMKKGKNKSTHWDHPK